MAITTRTFTCSCGRTVTGKINKGEDYCLECFFRAHPNPSNPRTGLEVQCEWCANYVYLTLSASLIPGHTFCSREHSNEWLRKTKVVLICKACGKSRKESPSHAKRYKVSYCSLKCRNSDPDLKLQLHQACLKQETAFESSVERLGFALLDSVGLEYVKQYSVKSKFLVDAMALKSKLALEFDGDYWHGNPVFYKSPDARQVRQMKRDIARDIYLTSCGYRVVRFWGSDLKHNGDIAKARLRSILAELL